MQEPWKYDIAAPSGALPSRKGVIGSKLGAIWSSLACKSMARGRLWRGYGIARWAPAGLGTNRYVIAVGTH